MESDPEFNFLSSAQTQRAPRQRPLPPAQMARLTPTSPPSPWSASLSGSSACSTRPSQPRDRFSETSLSHLQHAGSSTKSYNLKYPEHVLSAGKHLSVSGSFFLPADWFPFDRHTSYSAVCYLTSCGNQVLAESESPLILPLSVNPLSFREPS